MPVSKSGRNSAIKRHESLDRVETAKLFSYTSWSRCPTFARVSPGALTAVAEVLGKAVVGKKQVVRTACWGSRTSDILIAVYQIITKV